MSELDAFPPDVIPKLKTYVYRLIDPRNGETFYVGKGQGNRVFAHIRDELSQDGDELSDKLKRIREVRLAGFEVAQVIHRHGMDNATAFEVEVAVQDHVICVALERDARELPGQPHIKRVVQKHVRQQRRDRRALRAPSISCLESAVCVL